MQNLLNLALLAAWSARDGEEADLAAFPSLDEAVAALPVSPADAEAILGQLECAERWMEVAVTAAWAAALEDGGGWSLDPDSDAAGRAVALAAALATLGDTVAAMRAKSGTGARRRAGGRDEIE